MQTSTTNPKLDNEQNGAHVVRSLYAAMQRGNPEAVVDLLAEDVVFHVPGVGSNAGDYCGRAEVLGFLGQAVAKTGGTLQLELADVAEGAEHVIALARYTATRPGKTLLNRLCQVMRIRDGQVVESWFYSRDQYEVDEFWSE